jgi:hypothetical protein
MENKMEIVPMLPRPGTSARAVIDQLMVRPLAFSDAAGIYSISRRNVSGHYPNKNYVGLTVLRILKKYGHKTGKSGSRAPWKFGTCPPGCPIVPTSQDFVNDRFSLPGDEGLTIKEMEERFPIDCLVKYTKEGQDFGTLGRVVAFPGNPWYRTVMWTTTSEREDVFYTDIELFKPAISSKTRGSDDVGGAYTRQITPGFEIGDEVEYVGQSDPSMKGVRGVVKGIFRNKRQVRWGLGRGPSTEDMSDLKPAAKAETGPLKIGQFVECRKDGLVFPAKVMLGPLSEGDYKVVCPNGTFEWLREDQMTPKEEKDVYNATPNKPAYEGLAPESEQTKELRLKLEKSLAHDRQVHWARGVLAALDLEQKRALQEALKSDVTIRTADFAEDEGFDDADDDEY